MYRIEDNKIKYAPLYIHTFRFTKKKKNTKVEKNNKVLNTIAEKLRYYREKENLTQDDIANYVGISRVTYCRYEKGVNKYPFKVMLMLAERFEVDLDELLDDYRKFIYNQQGEKIKEIRKDLGGIKRYELSSILDVNDNVIKRCEEDKSYLTRDVYDRLMNLYYNYIENSVVL